MGKWTDAARELRPYIEKAAQSLKDSDALKAVTLYPKWETGMVCEAGMRLQDGGRLWRCLQDHTAQEGWQPENTPALFERIDETHAGTIEDPIPYGGNMALVSGLYYSQDGLTWLCFRDTGTPVYNTLSDLAGIYVEAA